MAGDPYRPVTGGEPFKPSARAWNSLMDLARTRDLGDTGASATPTFSRDADRIKVKNNTNANQEQFAILGLDVPLILPADNASEFRRQVTFSGVVPTTALHAGKFCVLQEPLAINSIGWALIAGVTPVNINTLSSSNATFAEITNSNTVVLRAASSGSAQILWAENTNNANTNAVVRLSVPPASAAAAAFFGCLLSASGDETAGATSSPAYNTTSYDVTGFAHGANFKFVNLPQAGYYRVSAMTNYRLGASPTNNSWGITGTLYYSTDGGSSINPFAALPASGLVSDGATTTNQTHGILVEGIIHTTTTSVIITHKIAPGYNCTTLKAMAASSIEVIFLGP